MDKREALRISKEYLQKVKSSNLGLSEAWLFGSFAIGSQHEDSEIDLAIILHEYGVHSFNTEVKLMLIRTGEETMIEPHLFTIEEFNPNLPIVNQITRYGERIEI